MASPVLMELYQVLAILIISVLDSVKPPGFDEQEAMNRAEKRSTGRVQTAQCFFHPRDQEHLQEILQHGFSKQASSSLCEKNRSRVCSWYFYF